MDTSACPCSCHGRYLGACDEDGGCGHLHRRADTAALDWPAQPAPATVTASPPRTTAPTPLATAPPSRVNVDIQGEGFRCRRAFRCVDRERTQDPVAGYFTGWVGAPHSSWDGLCRTCDAHCRAAVSYLVADVVELAGLLVPSLAVRRRVVDITDGSRVHPDLPLNIHPHAVAELIDYETTVWAENTAAEVEMTWDSAAAGQLTRAVRVQAHCQLLHHRWRWFIAAGPLTYRAHSVTERAADGHDEDTTTYDGRDHWATLDGISAALRLHDLHEQTVQLAGRAEPPPEPVPCPSCGHRKLIRRHRDHRVDCLHCHNLRMTDDQYDRYRTCGQWPLPAVA